MSSGEGEVWRSLTSLVADSPLADSGGQMGSQLLCWLLGAPGFVQQVIADCTPDPRGTTTTVRDLLPLPNMVTAEVKQEAARVAANLQHDDSVVRQVGGQAWFHVLIYALNMLHHGLYEWRPHKSATGGNQLGYVKCTEYLKEVAEQYAEDDGLGVLDGDVTDILSNKRLDYSGDLVSGPEKLTLEQIKPALPAPGVGGSVASEAVAAGRFKELLLNPAALIKPVSEWGDLLTAPVHASDDEWDAIGEYLVRCGVAE
eukprot:3894428-Amphidinium_carterae.2